MTSSEQKAQKAFGFRDSRDMLEKLRWELNNLFSRQRLDIAVCQYHAFNCAVTAWHVTDWLWLDIIPEVRARLEEKTQRRLNRCEEFQAYVRDACPELKLCHQIANGSKHCLLEHKPDAAISAGISGGEGYDYGNPIIMEGETPHLADKVFNTALVWFRVFLQEWNIFPEEPFVLSGDEPSTN
jgi:hypothetical protein